MTSETRASRRLKKQEAQQFDQQNTQPTSPPDTLAAQKNIDLKFKRSEMWGFDKQVERDDCPYFYTKEVT